MKRRFTLLIGLISYLFLYCSNLQAQQSANAAGGDATGSGGSASFSVGQVVYTVAGTAATSNHGVQQPYEFFTTGINDNKNISLALSAYPNPAQNILNLKVENLDFQNLNYQVYDINGRELISAKVTGTLNTIMMQNLASGPYTLRVTEGNQTIQSFKIIKNQ